MPKDDGCLTKISIAIVMLVILLLDLRWLLASSYIKIPSDLGGLITPYIIVIVVLLGVVFLRHFSSNLGKIFHRVNLQSKMLGENSIEFFKALNITAAKLLQGKSLLFESKSKARLIAVIRLTGRPKVPEVEMSDEDYSNRLEYIAAFYKLRDFFSGLQKRRIPCIYTVILNPIGMESKIVKSKLKQLESDVSNLQSSSRPLKAEDEKILSEEKAELKRIYLGDDIGFFQTEILLLIWVDGDKNNLDKLLNMLEGNVNSVLAAIVAVFPEMEAAQLENVELLDAVGNFFCPFPVFQPSF